MKGLGRVLRMQRLKYKKAWKKARWRRRERRVLNRARKRVALAYFIFQKEYNNEANECKTD